MPALQPGFEAITEREKGLHRGLSTGQLSMIAIGGAIGTGLFLGSGFAIGLAGPAVLVSYAIGALIALLLMGCLAEMTVAHPISGSFGAWAEFYISPLAGYLVRYAYWAGIMLAVGTEVTAIAVYMGFWFPHVPGLVWITGFGGVLVLVNAFNVKFFGSVEYGFSMVKISAILLFVALGSWVIFASPSGTAVGFSNYVTHGGFFPHGSWGMWMAVLVALFSYFGIEMIAIAAGEARDPQIAITRALKATVFRLVLFYLCTLAVIIAIVPWTSTASTTNQSPFVKVMAATHLPYAAGIINFVIVVAALSAMNSLLYCTTRMMFSLARAGHAPRSCGRLTSRGVPLAALLLSASGIAVAALVNALYRNAFIVMLAISLFGPLFAWLMIFVTHFYFRRRHAAETLPFRMWGFPYSTIVGTALMAAAITTTLFTQQFRMTIICGIPFLLALTAVFLIRNRRAPAPDQPLTEESLTT
jgi:AAT family amino acid transporter